MLVNLYFAGSICVGFETLENGKMGEFHLKEGIIVASPHETDWMTHGPFQLNSNPIHFPYSSLAHLRVQHPDHPSI